MEEVFDSIFVSGGFCGFGFYESHDARGTTESCSLVFEASGVET